MTQIGPWSEENPPTPAEVRVLRRALVRRKVERKLASLAESRRARNRETAEEWDRREKEFCERMVEEFRERGAI